MRHLQLAIDDQALPWRYNLALHLSQPTVRPAPVLGPSPFESLAPDNLATHFYGTVMQDQGRFRMWYYACHWGRNPDWSPRMAQQVAKPPAWAKGEQLIFQGPLCYAESDDGLTWHKPALGQVLFKGSRANNALALPHTVVSGAIVIRDDEDPDPARRYKMSYQFFPDQTAPIIPEYGRAPSVALAISPDGLAWTVIGIPFLNQFVEPSSFLKHQGQYLIHYQVMDQWAGYGAEGGTPAGRTGAVRMSPDFDHWPPVLAEAFALAEPEDKSKRNMQGRYDQVHLGVGASSFGNVCVGLYGLWHNANNAGAFHEISCDFGLVVSNDGVHFREPVKGHRFLRREDSLATPAPGVVSNTILCQANGLLNVGDETRIYHGRWRNVGSYQAVETLRHYSAEVALATLPRDRWGAYALLAHVAEGTAISAPVKLTPTARLTVNATGTAGLSLALLDEQFRPLPGFGSGSVTGGDGFEAPAHWPEQSLAALAGHAVRVQVTLRRQGKESPRLYALNWHLA